MPIEFNCSGCSKLLRTPDESAGKKAKCPQCGAIVDVPAGAVEGVTPAPVAPPAAAVSPFGPAPRAAESEQLNPYASPSHGAVKEISAPVAKGELVHTRITFDDTIQQTWAFFKEKLQPLALVGLTVLAINAGAQFILMMGGFAAGITEEPVVVVLFQIFNQIAATALQTYVAVGMAVFTTKLVRTGDAQIGDFFLASKYFWRGLGVTILVTLMVVGVIFVCLIPALATIPIDEQGLTIGLAACGAFLGFSFGMILWYRYGFISYYFLVDRDARVGQALSLSAEFMAGNKLTAFLVSLVVAFLWMLMVICTCLIGVIPMIIFLPAYQAMISAVIYFTATGQPWAQPAPKVAA